MKINLDYGRKLPLAADALSNRELTLDYINYAVTNAYPNGIEGKMRRVWGRIQRKFDTAIDFQAEDIELEETEKDFIKDSFKDSKFPSGIAKFVVVLEDEIAKLSEVK